MSLRSLNGKHIRSSVGTEQPMGSPHFDIKSIAGALARSRGLRVDRYHSVAGLGNVLC